MSGLTGIYYRDVYDVTGKTSGLQTLSQLTFKYQNPNQPVDYSRCFLDVSLSVTSNANIGATALCQAVDGWSIFNSGHLLINGIMVEQLNADTNYLQFMRTITEKSEEEVDNYYRATGFTSVVDGSNTDSTRAARSIYERTLYNSGATTSNTVLRRLYLNDYFKFLDSKEMKNAVLKGINLFEIRLYLNTVGKAFVSAPANITLSYNDISMRLRVPEMKLSLAREAELNRLLLKNQIVNMWNYWEVVSSDEYVLSQNSIDWKITTTSHLPAVVFIQFQASTSYNASTADINKYAMLDRGLNSASLFLNSQELPYNGGLRKSEVSSINTVDYRELYMMYQQVINEEPNDNRNPGRTPLLDYSHFVSDSSSQYRGLLAFDCRQDYGELFKVGVPVDVRFKATAAANAATSFRINAIIVSKRRTTLDFVNNSLVNVL